MNSADAFRSWAFDPNRTVDELCATELVLEWGENIWRGQQKQYSIDHEAQRRKRKERAGNPAYKPALNPTSVEHTIEVFHLLKHFYHSWHDDRPIRSVAPLQFIAALEDVNLGQAEVRDLSPLQKLPNLKRLTIHEPGTGGGFVIKDLSALTGLKIESLSIALRTPWPAVHALTELPNLETLAVRANLLALREIPILPNVKKANFDAEYHCRTPLRSFDDLPEMPKVTSLRVDGIAGLQGVERFPQARNLDLVGPYDDLSPLATLTAVTHLRLEGDLFMDLAPLTRLPNLREIVLVRERPLDLSPLADAPALREVFVERCAILRTELSALNAALPPWGLDFLAPEPRPLQPLRFFSYRIQDPDVKARQSIPEENPREKLYDGDTFYATAESRWFGRELQQRLDALLGVGWGDAHSFPCAHPGSKHLTIQRFKDIIRFDEILQTVRELIASCRFPWSILVSAEPHGDLSKDMEEIRAQREEQERDWLDQEYDADQEREDYEEFRKSRRELYERLEREHRLRLLQQQGEEINPADFSPGAEKSGKVPAKAGAESGDFDEDEDDEEMEDFDQEQTEFEEEMSFVFVLTENYVWVVDHMRETFESTLGVRTEDWHALPEPPEQRPRPQL